MIKRSNVGLQQKTEILQQENARLQQENRSLKTQLKRHNGTCALYDV